MGKFSFTQDENQKIIIKYYQKKEMSIFWTYNKRRWGTTIANGRKDKWLKRTGRPRTMWTVNIKEWTKISYNDCIRVAQDREQWRSMTADLLTTDAHNDDDDDDRFSEKHFQKMISRKGLNHFRHQLTYLPLKQEPLPCSCYLDPSQGSQLHHHFSFICCIYP